MYRTWVSPHERHEGYCPARSKLEDPKDYAINRLNIRYGTFWSLSGCNAGRKELRDQPSSA
jgi:hypothetical protein